MSGMVQVAVAADVTEAEELQAILTQAGIETALEPAVEHHPREVEDAAQKVFVPEDKVEQAIDAIEAMTEPDELVSDA
jgi:hypothetical protein